MFARLVRPSLLAALALAAGACRTDDPFAWKDERPEPRLIVRQRRLAGTSRLIAAPYAEVYRAAARSLDASAFHHVERGPRALIADDVTGMSSAGLFFRTTADDLGTLVEAVFVLESSDLMGPEQRRRREQLLLDGVEEELQAARRRAPGEAPRPGLARDAERERLLGAPVSEIDRLEAVETRVRPDDLAVVVGAERHENLPVAPYAARDAALFREYAERALGVPPANVIFLADAEATREKVAVALERARSAAKPHSRVWFYYAGFGGADPRAGAAYLATHDADPRQWAATTLSLDQLYGALERIKAAQVTAFLDASFDGSGARTWNEEEHSSVARGARLPAAPPAVTVFLASAPGEGAGDLEEHRHGVFTYYLLRGLRGEAAYGRHMALEDLGRYLYRMMTAWSRRTGVPQTPVGRGPQEILLW